MFSQIVNCFIISFSFYLFSCVNCMPQGEFRLRIPKQSEMNTLTLPSNATSIRDDIVDTFSCENKTYGYYADVDNDCQIFHVCLPVTYSDGKNQTFRWSFICPESTVFSQEIFVCVREEDLNIKCEESTFFYNLNDNFGDKEEEEVADGEMSQDNTNMDQSGDMNPAPAETDTMKRNNKINQSRANSTMEMKRQKGDKKKNTAMNKTQDRHNNKHANGLRH